MWCMFDIRRWLKGVTWAVALLTFSRRIKVNLRFSVHFHQWLCSSKIWFCFCTEAEMLQRDNNQTGVFFLLPNPPFVLRCPWCGYIFKIRACSWVSACVWMCPCVCPWVRVCMWRGMQLVPRADSFSQLGGVTDSTFNLASILIPRMWKSQPL